MSKHFSTIDSRQSLTGKSQPAGQSQLIDKTLLSERPLSQGRPLISVVIPAHNAEPFIERAIKSVLNQSYDNWELIIVENGSDDLTYCICEKYLYDNRIILERSEKGVSNARNKGIKSSNGDWLTFLDADDSLTDNALELMASGIGGEVDIVVGDYDHKRDRRQARETMGKDIFLKACLCNPTQYCNVTAVLFSSELIRRNNLLFQEDLTHAEDSVFFVKAVIQSRKVMMLNKTVYHVYYNPASAVRKKDCNNIEAYCSSIACIKVMLAGEDDEVNEALNAFILNQILILMVHDVCTGIKDISGYHSAQEKFDVLMNKDILTAAFEDKAFRLLPANKRVCLQAMRMRWFPVVVIIVKCRQLINHIRSKSEKWGIDYARYHNNSI